MDTILGIPPGESYSGIRELADLSVCIKYTNTKQWYSQTIGSMQGDWKTLCSKFCLHFFPISKVVSLRKEVLNFRQLEEESLGSPQGVEQ